MPAHSAAPSRGKRWRIHLEIVVAIAIAAALVAIGVGGHAPSATTSAAPNNLLTQAQSCFGGSTGGWSGYSATLSYVSTPVADTCTGALTVTSTPAGSVNDAAASGNGPKSWTPAKPQARYASAAYVQTALTSRAAAGVEAFYDASGNVLTAVWGGSATDLPGTWTQLPTVVAIAPAGTAYVSFLVIFYGTQHGEVHYVDAATITGTTVSARPVEGPLRTEGNQIVRPDGRPIVLRGIMREGTEVSVSDFPSDAEIAQARAWGANVVRVPLNEALWLNTCTPDSPSNVPSYPPAVDAEVNSITSRGMVAILDLHFSVTAACGPASQQAMADEQFAPTFWAQVASRYESNPLVAFDLYNEPHDTSDGVWLNGGPAPAGGTTFDAAGMQQLYDTVRSTGATNLVFVSGTNWASTPATTLVSGTNIVNAVHAYTCQTLPCSAANPFDPSVTLSQWTGVARVQPVMITESGYPSSTDGQNFNSALISDAESFGWGWIIFGWDGTTSGEFDLLATLGSTYEPAPAGMPLLAGLERNQ